MTQEEKAKAYDDAIKRAKRMFSEKELNYLFPELAESDDEKIISAIRKAIEAKVENLGNGVTRTACLAWLEKQGEPIDEEKVDNQNCVKPSVKGEPKFKVGDYVVDNCGYVWRIEGIINQFYILEGIDGGESRPTIEWVNKTFHLWDITEDAKNGDVLVASDGSIFLFAGVVDYACKYYAALATDDYVKINKETKGGYWETSRAVYPATKEQRDKLKKAMADAGYVFDFEKKELKEIENEEYDGEDYGIDSLWHAKNILEKTLGEVEGYQTDDGILDHKCAISFIDKLYKQKPAEWSEEDESNFQGIIDELKANKHHAPDSDLPTYDRFLSWFKSLKGRYVWKPSDEQMKILSIYKNVNDVLASLYQDLKKLKG